LIQLKTLNVEHFNKLVNYFKVKPIFTLVRESRQPTNPVQVEA
jgi:hypothetical protein